MGSDSAPTRSQLSAARQSQPHDLYIGRGKRDTRYQQPSKWGNPFRVRRAGRAAALSSDRDYVLSSTLRAMLHELAGKTLLCSCSPSQRCHGDVLITLFEENGLADRQST